MEDRAMRNVGMHSTAWQIMPSTALASACSIAEWATPVECIQPVENLYKQEPVRINPNLDGNKKKMLTCCQATNKKEGGSPAIVEALTSQLEEARVPGVKYTLSLPEYTKTAQ
jgi:hypothetical protein